MNIWIFNHYAVGPNSIGITRHYDLAKALVERGHNVTIFASSFNHQKRQEEQSYQSEKFILKEYGGVKFYWIKTPAYYKNDMKRIINMLVYTYRVNNLTKKVKEIPDIVIGSLMHPLAAILGYKVARKKGAKFYFEERDLWPQSLIDLGKVSPRNPIVKILSRLELFLYNKADKIVVLFDKAPKYVKQRGINSNKIIYLPNGVDIQRYAETFELPTKYTETFEELKNKFIVMYTGAHSLANYLEAVIEIAEEVSKQNSHIHFVLVGDGPDKNSIIEKANASHLSNITFLPAIQKKYVPSILMHADMGIITMRNAGVYKWGISLNKMYDYMAASLPIVMLSNLEDSVVSKNKLGVVVNDLNSISRKIVELSENPVVLSEYSTNSIEYVHRNHDWDILAGKLERIMLNDVRSI